ncbi:hypothetical protein ACFYN0_34880 [Streptomyces sp. NPDC006704]|uniref:hypothetical protein n=1 Tax=Streptomyces sp. NPDC006704 TaxID=3364760 RepID=UPI003699A09E
MSESTTPWWYRVPSVAVTIIPMVAVTLIVWSVMDEGARRVPIALVCGVVAGWLLTAIRGAAQSEHDRRRGRGQR